jgi:hypothetical protein
MRSIPGEGKKCCIYVLDDDYRIPGDRANVWNTTEMYGPLINEDYSDQRWSVVVKTRVTMSPIELVQHLRNLIECLEDAYKVGREHTAILHSAGDTMMERYCERCHVTKVARAAAAE